jgi:MFS transporter, ACS family, tartrate transporter
MQSGAQIDQIVRKVAWRLLPFLLLGWFLCNIDRGNVGFASLTMNKELGLTAEIFGFGGGVFFLGLIAAEMPANFLILRFGPKRWITWVILSWGTVATAMGIIVSDATSFIVMRFLLGVTEAGFLPGVLYYLTLWFPRAYRGRFNSMFMSAVAISLAAGGPLAASLMTLDGFHGVRGWRWIFVVEGLPTILLGFFAWRYLDDNISTAKWLRPDEKELLLDTLARERAEQEKVRSFGILEALRNPMVIILALSYSALSSATVTLALFLPQILNAQFKSYFIVAAVMFTIYGAAGVGMVLWGRRSDRRGERILHTALPILLSGVGWYVASVSIGNVQYLLPTLIITALGLMGAAGVFWTVPSLIVTGVASAPAIALVCIGGHI